MEIKNSREYYNSLKLIRKLYIILESYKDGAKRKFIEPILNPFKFDGDEEVVEFNTKGEWKTRKKSLRDKVFYMKNKYPLFANSLLGIDTQVSQYVLTEEFLLNSCTSLANLLDENKYIVFVNGAYGGASVNTAHSQALPVPAKISKDDEKYYLNCHEAMKQMNEANELKVPSYLYVGKNGQFLVKIFKPDFVTNKFDFFRVFELIKENDQYLEDFLIFHVTFFGSFEAYTSYFDNKHIIESIELFYKVLENMEKFALDTDLLDKVKYIKSSTDFLYIDGIIKSIVNKLKIDKDFLVHWEKKNTDFYVNLM